MTKVKNDPEPKSERKVAMLPRLSCIPPPPVLGDVSVRTDRGLNFGGEKKKAVVVIDEDLRKGADVPSPHPRRSARGAGNGGGESVDGVSVICSPPLLSYRFNFDSDRITA